MKLIDAADVQRGEVVLEVGPGTGTLTSALLERGAMVIACEIDAGLADLVEHQFPTVGLLRGDALAKQRSLNPDIIAAIGDRPFKLVANLPYQIASPLMTTLLIDHPNCVGQFVTIQREVADRLMAKPNTKAYGPLSIIVQALAEVRLIGTLSPACFWPQPEVTSAMVGIIPQHQIAQLHPVDSRDFARFITELFSKRRKQLGTTFGRTHQNWPAGVTPEQRPESLTISQHIALWQAFASKAPR